jgi:hypothetical protein
LRTPTTISTNSISGEDCQVKEYTSPLVSTSPPFGVVNVIHGPAGLGVAEGMTFVGVLVGVLVFVGVRLGFMDAGAAAAGEYNTANIAVTIKSIRLNGKSFRNMNGLLGIQGLYTTSIFNI